MIFAEVSNNDTYVTINLWNVLIVVAIIALIIYILRHRRY